ncbi:zinc finger protein 577 [Fopius arisanus]|uniref:ZNF585B_0 protein n=1 Tax=Fopius arisanus TaxID=64838 RepID=A0A0C9R581_9HYME|nr:PREDICTED: zinc finger protein 577-like [Fopius arisanus]
MSDTELCRLCAESKIKVIGIYDPEGLKLAIEEKIAKFLDLQVVTSDNLPLSICTDCYDLLDQCSLFYERSHQAQISLRHLLIDIKPLRDSSDSTVDSVEKIIGGSNKTEEETAEFGDDYIPGDELDPDYLTDDVEQREIPEVDHKYAPAEVPPEKEKILRTKKTPKQSMKQVRRRTRKLSPIASGSDTEDVKIPENYMTGTESDKEMIESRIVDYPKSKTRGRTLDRYPWLCTDCNDKLPSLDSLEQHHKITHNQQAKYMCVQCCKIFDKYQAFLSHVRRHKNKSKFTCEECGKSFVHKKVLESHRAIHSEERPHVCQTCGKSFRQQSALYIHGRCHLPDTMKNRYPCDQCGKRFSTKPNLVTHKRIHSGVRNFTCDQCGKSFIQKGNLEAHFLTHSADKPYNCSLCTKAFKTPLQLKKHETVHTGDKPHQCAVCGRTFREKGTLREHHRIHTGAMPFTCEFCGKCFRFKGILTTHRRQHTGERPYSCLECQHHFTNWPNYNKHMKRRHGINTSHTKHLPQNPLQLHVQEEEAGGQSTESAGNVEVTHIIAETSTQSIILETVPTPAVETFQTESPANIQTAPLFRDKNTTTTYFNAVPVTIQNFLTPNVPYNFYTVPSVNENESILPK